MSEAWRPCELCRAPAHVLCPSDDAFLCRRCDCLVHNANFLVARHHRTFLCRYCARPTASGACGAFLPAASPLCISCSPSVCCSSRSEASDCSEMTSDSDSEREYIPWSMLAATGCKRPSAAASQPSFHEDDNVSDAMSGLEEEGASPSSSCSVEGADGNASSYAKYSHSRYEFAKG